MTTQHPLPFIRGQLIWLRTMECQALPEFARGGNDFEIETSAGYHAPTSMLNLEQWYEDLMKEHYTKDGYYFTICELGSDEVIGFGELPLERIYLLVQADNTRAIRSYEKANVGLLI